MPSFEHQTFEKIDYTLQPLEKGEYEQCVFLQCNFANTDIGNIRFSECEFVNCNMSMTTLVETSLRDVHFRDCKLMGMAFGSCSNFLFSVGFESCILNLSSFHRLKMRKTLFLDCSLQEVSFIETDLGESIFTNCDLMGALFERTILEKADFRTAINYTLNPETNAIKKAKFSQGGIAGLLQSYDIEISI